MENQQDYKNWFAEEKGAFMSVISDFLSCGRYENISPEERTQHLEDISDALNMANEDHKDETRDSGEPYIIHPMAVSRILIEVFRDSVTVEQVIIALLHDVIESEIEICGSGDNSRMRIEERFGKKVAQSVFNLSKKAKEDYIRFSERDNPPDSEELKKRRDMEYFSGLAFLADDELRVKSADFIHSIETLHHCGAAKQEKILKRGYRVFLGILRIRFPDTAEFLCARLINLTLENFKETISGIQMTKN